MLRNLLHFGEQTAGDICVTRGDIIAVPVDISFDDLVRAFADAGHSRLPVYGESLDEVVGMVHIKDVFIANVDPSRDRSLAALMREPLFVPESMGVIELLARMRAERIHLAIVVDEFGGTEGLVTIEDVVEEIVGDIEDEHDEAEAGMLTMLDDGLWEADARLELEELAASGRPAPVVRRGRSRHARRPGLPARRPHPGQGRMRDPPFGLEARSGRFRPAPDHPRPASRARRRSRRSRLVLREQLGRVGHRLEFERIAGGIEEEHRRLLARLALEAHRRRDHELDAGVARAARPAPSTRPSAARARNAAPARPRRRPDWSRGARTASGREMRDDLMAVEIEIDPMVGAAPFGAAEQLAVEAARGGEVVDRKGEMEGRQGSCAPPCHCERGDAICRGFRGLLRR